MSHEEKRQRTNGGETQGVTPHSRPWRIQIQWTNRSGEIQIQKASQGHGVSTWSAVAVRTIICFPHGVEFLQGKPRPCGVHNLTEICAEITDGELRFTNTERHHMENAEFTQRAFFCPNHNQTPINHLDLSFVCTVDESLRQLYGMGTVVQHCRQLWGKQDDSRELTVLGSVSEI